MFSLRFNNLFCTVRVPALHSYKWARGKFFIAVLELEKMRQSLGSFLLKGETLWPVTNLGTHLYVSGLECLSSSSAKFLTVLDVL